MAKSLCKYRRVEIADQFAMISKLVSEPKYICSSCARSASDKAYLCKPSALKARPPVAVPTVADKASAAPGNVATVSKLPAPSPTVQAHLAAVSVSEQEQAAVQPTVTKKQAKQLKKLAKKKNKRLKKAAKAVQRYDQALQKALQL
ncbi:hypothetical protein MD588_20180 [Photobacterium sp. SDRW27]|uniref:hypothetical protein n=1 Tax=Photobacterium obscurum TaxID=2829490 RepID=UPI0022433C2E|nr:hypothetical protein [Photobacterium obscurum]MCW8331118.1 hypothetical protein [Photobacterium obscurum]